MGICEYAGCCNWKEFYMCFNSSNSNFVISILVLLLLLEQNGVGFLASFSDTNTNS
jgi:hypothetical protein